MRLSCVRTGPRGAEVLKNDANGRLVECGHRFDSPVAQIPLIRVDQQAEVLKKVMPIENTVVGRTELYVTFKGCALRAYISTRKYV